MDMDELARELEEIEGKYTPKTKKCSKIPISLHESLTVLSKEFDCLGLPDINVEKSMLEILEQVVKTSRDLVQIHRNAVTRIKENNVENVTKNFKHQELYGEVNNFKESLEKLQEKCNSLKNNKSVLINDVKELKRRETAYKEELKKVKRNGQAREELLEHNVKQLQLEIERLKKLTGRDLGKSKSEFALLLLNRYKFEEELYKSTINKMEENNRGLLDEILSLKEEIILLRARQ